MMTALIVGATGLVGSFCLQKLLDSGRYTTVLSVGRRPIGISHPKLKEIQIELQDLAKVTDQLKADDYFCCLGTTIKKARTHENFRKIDFEAPLQLAKAAKANHAKQFLIVSALGANSNSSIFYNQVKGELEDELKKLGLPSLKIFQPSLLLGPRRELRAGEKIFQPLVNLPIWFGPLKKFKPIQAETVANSMIKSAERSWPGTIVLESGDMQNS